MRCGMVIGVVRSVLILLMKAECMKWEYMTLMFASTGFLLGGNLDAQRLTDRLNELGAEGWELVSVFDTNMRSGQSKDVYAILKRAFQSRK